MPPAVSQPSLIARKRARSGNCVAFISRMPTASRGEQPALARASGPGREAPRPNLSGRLRWAAGAARLTLREPAEGLDRVLGRARRLLGAGAAPAYGYLADPECERHLHERLGCSWPCNEMREFETLWSQVAGALEHRGLPMGRATYGGWDDGDRRLASMVWCMTRHLRPALVVETGVARGITSRVILEAMERNGAGALYSIDLPALDRSLHAEIGAAVPADLRARWTYVNGTSRRRLPALLAELGEIDLFVHDSSHTARNMRFELGCASTALRRGAIVADDIHRNDAFANFTRSHPDAPSFVATADDGKALFGIALKGL